MKRALSAPLLALALVACTGTEEPASPLRLVTVDGERTLRSVNDDAPTRRVPGQRHPLR